MVNLNRIIELLQSGYAEANRREIEALLLLITGNKIKTLNSSIRKLLENPNTQNKAAILQNLGTMFRDYPAVFNVQSLLDIAVSRGTDPIIFRGLIEVILVNSPQQSALANAKYAVQAAVAKLRHEFLTEGHFIGLITTIFASMAFNAANRPLLVTYIKDRVNIPQVTIPQVTLIMQNLPQPELVQAQEQRAAVGELAAAAAPVEVQPAATADGVNENAVAAGQIRQGILNEDERAVMVAVPHAREDVDQEEEVAEQSSGVARIIDLLQSGYTTANSKEVDAIMSGLTDEEWDKSQSDIIEL